MNPAVQASAERLTDWLQANKSAGTRASSEAIDQLNRKLNGLVPDWLCQLWQEYPLSGATATLHQSNLVESLPVYLYSGIDMVRECLENAPGSKILSEGYICFAGDELGTGDQICLCVYGGGDPPVYSVCHESLSKTVITSQLSSFFFQLAETVA